MILEVHFLRSLETGKRISAQTKTQRSSISITRSTKPFLDHTSSSSKNTRLSVTLPLPSKDLCMGLSTFEARNRTVHATPPPPQPPTLALHLLRCVALGTKFNLCAPQFPQLEAVKVVTPGKVFTNVNHRYGSILPSIIGICIIS